MLSAHASAPCSAHPADAPRRKPLYLATRSPVRIGAEGESLVVRGAQGQAQRFPVARVDRVVCNRHTDWTGAALTLCLARGINVTWVAGNGEALGDCTARLAEPSSLHASLERYLENPRWACAYGNWLRRRRMALQVRWARERLARGLSVERGEWETLKREFVYKGLLPATLAGDIKGWCHALVVARLRDAGLNGRYWGYDGEALELAADLAALLWAGVNLDAGTLMGGAGEPRTLAMAFEAGMRAHNESLRDHLAHLRRHVAQALDAWL